MKPRSSSSGREAVLSSNRGAVVSIFAVVIRCTQIHAVLLKDVCGDTDAVVAVVLVAAKDGWRVADRSGLPVSISKASAPPAANVAVRAAATDVAIRRFVSAGPCAPRWYVLTRSPLACCRSTRCVPNEAGRLEAALTRRDSLFYAIALPPFVWGEGCWDAQGAVATNTCPSLILTSNRSVASAGNSINRPLMMS